MLTPNKVEFERLAKKLGVAVGSPDALQSICRRRAGWALGQAAPDAGCDNHELKQAAGNPMGNLGPACEIGQPSTRLFCQSQVCRPARPCSLGGPVVVRKGREDAVGDGHHVVVCDEEGSPRRAGGQVRSGQRWFEGLRVSEPCRCPCKRAVCPVHASAKHAQCSTLTVPTLTAGRRAVGVHCSLCRLGAASGRRQEGSTSRGWRQQ